MFKIVVALTAQIIATAEAGAAPVARLPGGAALEVRKQLSGWQGSPETVVLEPAVISAPMSRARISSRFGMRFDPLRGHARLHAGIDLAQPRGTPVHASLPGRVSRASWAGAYGLMIEIDHGDGLVTRYAHLSGLAALSGMHVASGDLIGYVGSTGRSTGNHLHFEVRLDGRPQNPGDLPDLAVARPAASIPFKDVKQRWAWNQDDVRLPQAMIKLP